MPLIVLQWLLCVLAVGVIGMFGVTLRILYVILKALATEWKKNGWF